LERCVPSQFERVTTPATCRDLLRRCCCGAGRPRDWVVLIPSAVLGGAPRHFSSPFTVSAPSLAAQILHSHRPILSCPLMLRNAFAFPGADWSNSRLNGVLAALPKPHTSSPSPCPRRSAGFRLHRSPSEEMQRTANTPTLRLGRQGRPSNRPAAPRHHPVALREAPDNGYLLHVS